MANSASINAAGEQNVYNCYKSTNNFSLVFNTSPRLLTVTILIFNSCVCKLHCKQNRKKIIQHFIFYLLFKTNILQLITKIIMYNSFNKSILKKTRNNLQNLYKITQMKFCQILYSPQTIDCSLRTFSVY